MSVILVIEDNQTTRKVVRLTLVAEGFEVIEVGGGIEALAAVERKAPDLVLQDLLLPDMDGFELVGRLRALPEMAGVPIVAFSGFVSRLECGRAAAVGFTDFVSKPVEPSRLVQVIRAHLPDPAAGRPSESRTHVLLVDDDPVQLKVGGLWLRELGFTVETAMDGVGALYLLRHGTFDAVITDVLMPRMDGFKLCGEIRRDPGLSSLPVILTSSNYLEPADRVLAEHMGASAFVVRRPDMTEAIAALRFALSRPSNAGAPRFETAPAEHHDRVVRQLERQAAMNSVFAHRFSMQASMLSVAAGVSEALTRHGTVNSSLPDILASVLDASGVSRGALFLSMGDADLALGTTLGFGEASVAELTRFCGHRAVFDGVLASGAPWAVAIASEGSMAGELLARIGVGCVMMIPFASGDCRGILLLGSRDRDLAQDDWIAFARMMAVQIGQALALSRAVSKLADSEKYSRRLIDGASDSIVTLDLDGTIKQVNPAAELFFAQPAVDLIGRSIFDVISPAGRAKAAQNFAVIDTSGISFGATPFIRPGGGGIVIADISASLVEIGTVRVALLIWRDVTERHRSTQELERLQTVLLAANEARDVPSLFEAVLRTLGEQGDWTIATVWRPQLATSKLACEHVWTKSPGDRVRLASLAESLFALGEGLIGRAWASRRVSWTHDLAREADCVRSAAASRLGVHSGLMIPIAADGEVIAILELYTDTPSEDDSFVKFATAMALQLGSVIDRKRDQDARRESEARFARLWDSGIVGVAIADLDGHVYDANDEYLRMLGYSRAELIAGEINWATLTPSECKPIDTLAMQDLLATGATRCWEKEYVRRDGTRAPVQIGVARLDQTRCIAYVSDLSERKQAEASLRASDEQFRHAQKMEAVGQLAGGIAHDFNNALSVVLCYGEMIVEQLRPGEPMREDAEEICKAAQRAAGLTRQLLTFSRQQVIAPRVLDLDEVVLDLEKMLQRILGADIELVRLRTNRLGCVSADLGSIEQVIMNLVVNARDAMPTGGILTLETADVVLDEDYTRAHHGAVAGPHVMLSVSDTGLGMDRATQARIFEPFYTTKPQGKGTGLGLSTVFGIVQQSGGSIWVYSEPGLGTTFKIYLPRVDAEAETVVSSVAPTTQRGTETILLVEDEDQVRAVARDILRRNGYQVIEARNAGEAILLAESSPVLDMLLTDVVMPQMSGPVLAKRMAAGRPEMKILCMSGYTDDSITRHGVLDTTIAYLQKPFTHDTLTRKVREVLDTRA
jgi:PAS domain S-box-containing protein